jgi:hypothetical protein
MTDEEVGAGGAAVMTMSALANVQIEESESTVADGDDDWDGGAATMMMQSPADSDSGAEEDIATMMFDGIDAGTLAALQSQVARGGGATAPSPAAGERAPAPPRAPRPPIPAASGGLPGWSSGGQKAARRPVGAPPVAAPIVAAGPWPSPRAAGAAPERSMRDVTLRRALVVSIVVFALLLVAIVWLLLRRNGSI